MSIDHTEVRVESKTGASKGQKAARFDLIPAEPLRQLAVHYGFGASKYPGIKPVNEDGSHIDNWRLGFPFSSSAAALMRHFNLWMSGEDIDEESGSNHLVAVMWHCMTLLQFQATPGFSEVYDDRQDKILTPPDVSIEHVVSTIRAYGGELVS